MRRRILGAIPGLIVAIALAVFLITSGWARGIRMALVIPFWFSMLGLFQAAERTCVVQAARGMCETDDGEVPIDESERAPVALQARRVYIETTAAALILTAIIYAL